MYSVNLLTRTMTAAVVALFSVAFLNAQASAPGAHDSEAILFENPPVVETAALFAQTLKDAPANVSVITENDIRRYGYRTLAEALANVRGFYFSSDGYLQYAGVRGFSLPGDFNTRILVMVNGHQLIDNVYGSMYMFGQDFGIDMDLVQRIEIVRGPSSALYGTNGIFATINIFTKAPVDSKLLTMSTEFGSFGEKKALVSSSMYLGRGANLLLAVSGFHSRGREIITSPSGDFAGGTTDKVGAEQGYHTLAQLTFRNWSVMANFADRRIITPFGIYSSDFGDPGSNVRDSHNYLEASWAREVGKASSVRLRFSYDQLRYFGRYDYTLEEGHVSDTRDEARGDWLGTQFTLRTPLSRIGALTFGGQLNTDIRNEQRTYYFDTPDVLDRYTSAPDVSYGIFAQQEWNVSRKLTAYLGVRLDDSKLQSAFLSPKMAAVYKPSEQTSYKLMYGRAFRNPSTYERFWEPNPLLEAERMNTYEFSAERALTKHVDLVGSVFHYRLDGMIEGVAVTNFSLQYRNVSASRSTGAEVELRGQPVDWLHLSAALTAQRTRYEAPSRLLPNSPARISSFQAGLPLFSKHLNVSSSVRYMSSRQTVYGSAVPAVALADLTLTTQRIHRNFDLQFGVRNIADKRYADPLSEEHLPAVLPRAGRSVFVKLIWKQGE
jgi:outer membrane receptor for ferrienterochelin and colicins